MAGVVVALTYWSGSPGCPSELACMIPRLYRLDDAE
jgi:hypothetical protein